MLEYGRVRRQLDNEQDAFALVFALLRGLPTAGSSAYLNTVHAGLFRFRRVGQGALDTAHRVVSVTGGMSCDSKRWPEAAKVDPKVSDKSPSLPFERCFMVPLTISNIGNKT